MGQAKGGKAGRHGVCPRAAGPCPGSCLLADGGLASGPELTAAGHSGYTGHAGEQAVFAQGSGGCRKRCDGPARGRRPGGTGC